MADQQQGVEIKLENGMVIKGDNPEEALKNAAKIIEDNSKAYRETKASLDELQGRFDAFQTQQQQPRREEPTSGFSKDKYYQLLHDDPLLAANYLDAARFQLDRPEDVPATFQGMQNKISQFDAQIMAAGFTNSHPDFPDDAATAQALTGRVKQLQNEGYPTTINTMHMAWEQLKDEGRVKPMVAAESQQEELPPSLGGAGSTMSPAEIQKAENLSDAELYKYLQSKGMFK